MRERLVAEAVIAPADAELVLTTDDPAEVVAAVRRGAERQGAVGA